MNHSPTVFEIPRESRIIDIGCGLGHDLTVFKELGYSNVVGVEPDDYCLEVSPHPEVRRGRMEATGFPPGSFDVAFVNNVFHHTESYIADLAEIHTILRPGGALCFIEPRPTMLRRSMDWMTFSMPLARKLPFLRERHAIMKMEMETGLYPKWLDSYAEFLRLLSERFEIVWCRNGPLFVFCKAIKK